MGKLLAGPPDDVDLLGGASLAANQYWQASRDWRPRSTLAAWIAGSGRGESAQLNRRESQLDPGPLVHESGCATALRTPDTFDPSREGTRCVYGYWSQPSYRLDVVVATHPHADHVAGLPAVLARSPVSVVLDPGARATRRSTPRSSARWRPPEIRCGTRARDSTCRSATSASTS